MGNFLVVVPSSGCGYGREANRLFRSGLDLARLLKFQAPSDTVETEWVCAASFPRQNGSGTPIVTDPATGSWLLAVGTWFHRDDQKSGDESYLLQRYLDVGPDRLAEEIEGFFVILIGDSNIRETIVLTDIVGSCHGFMRSCRNTVILSGSSLLLAGLGDVRLDHVGCQEFICAGTAYEDRTVFREVRKLGPARVLRFAQGVLKTERRYWKISDLPLESLDGQPAVAALWGALGRAAQRIGRLFLHPVCDLTGGYDSRAIAAAFLSGCVPFSTTVSGAPQSRDVIVSRRLAQVAGVPHLYVASEGPASFSEVLEALPFTDGEFNLIEYSRILRVQRALSERFDISINGSFGGIARALWWELLFPRIGAHCRLDAEKLARQRYAALRFDASLFAHQMQLDLATHLTGVIERINAGLWGLPNTAQMDHVNLSMRIHRWQGRIATGTNRLWPCLSPFGLRSVLETALQIRANLRLRSLVVRRMLAQYQPRLAECPLDRGYPALPVTGRNLYRFWPAPLYLGKRVLSKGARLAGLNRGVGDPLSGETTPRLQLWRENEVRALLDTATMRLFPLVDKAALGDFLRRSQRRDFSFNDQWERLLSLECALRTQAEMRASIRL